MATAPKKIDRDTQKLMEDMEKKFGKNVLRVASEIKEEMMGRTPTGSFKLDLETGGGYPDGRFIQVSGGFSTTKSTTVYHGIANAQKRGKKCALILSENGSWTAEYGEQIGINTSELLINECASMEEALEITRQLQERGIADFIVWDSVEAFEPMKELDSSMEDTVQMGLKPKMFGEFLRKFQALNNRLSREGRPVCTLIGINQLREKIGAYGDPEYETGGRALGFASSLIIRLRRGEWITVGTGANKRIIGQQVKFKISKSKVSIPQRSGDWDVYIDEGGTVPQGHIDNFKSLVIESIVFGVIEKRGGWFKYGEHFNIQGADKVVIHLRDNPELYEEIKDKTIALSLDDAQAVLEELVESGELDALNEKGEEEIYDEEIGVEEPKKPTKKPTAKRGAKK